MNKFILSLMSLLCLCTEAMAQNNVGVNTNTPGSTLSVNGNAAIGTNYAGQAAPTNGAAIEGNVGIGVLAPVAGLHVVNNDGILAQGVLGSGNMLSMLGLGTRMFFYPKKAAFRAGLLDNGGAQWDDANIGDGSFASGINTRAFGVASTASGANADAYGFISTAFGASTVANGAISTAMRNGTTASGEASTAMGSGTLASGTTSTAMGAATQATGGSSTAMGHGSIASAQYATAMGLGSEATGFIATAIGHGSNAFSRGEVAIGQHNTNYTPINTTNFNATDRLLVVGNGVDNANRSDAMVILKNGNTGFGTSTPTEKLEVVGNTKTTNFQMTNGAGATKVLQSDANGNATWVLPSSLGVTGPAGPQGTIGATGATGATGPAGTYTTGTGINITSGTISSIATLNDAYTSTGVGAGRTIDANNGAVLVAGNDGFQNTGTYGSGTTLALSGGGTKMFFYPKKAAFRAGGVIGNQWNDVIIGDYSTAMGYSTIASGAYSTAMGQSATASGNYSAAMGYSTNATGYASIAMGYFGVASAYYSTAMGANTTAQSRAETTIGAYNTNAIAPNATNWVTTDRLFTIGNGTSAGALSDALVMLKNGNTTFTGIVTAPSFVTSSDKRFKKNIVALNSVSGSALNNLGNIGSYYYDYRVNEFPERQFTDAKQIGFIAQEIETIYPELVATDAQGYKSVDYAKMTPILVEAIKELKAQNEALTLKATKAAASAEKAEANFELLKAQVEKLNNATFGNAQK